jgi:hypothetical protein
VVLVAPIIKEYTSRYSRRFTERKW